VSDLRGSPQPDTTASGRALTFDGEYTALFASMWPATPVFHAFAHNVRDERGDVTRDLARCGRIVSSYDRSTGKLTEKMQWVPMRHALVFGRPCRKCFPDVR
jgi:hypothetical protein